MSDSLRPHESQHARPHCPSPSPGVHSNSHPSSRWCHPAISSSVVPFSSCPWSLPATEFFPRSQLFAWGGQSTGVSTLASFLPKDTLTIGLYCFKFISFQFLKELLYICFVNCEWSYKITAPLLKMLQFSSVTQSGPTFSDPMNRSTPGLPVPHQLPEFTQTHVHRVSYAIQPSHPLSSPSPPAPNLSQRQSLFQWVNPSHEMAKVLEFQL